MANIVFKSKKTDSKKPTENKVANLSLGIFANFFHWFIVLAGVVILASGYWWLLKPKYDLIINDEEFKKEEKVYQDKVAYLQQLRAAKNAYDKISASDKNKVDTVLAAGQDIETLKISLLQQLTTLAKLNGATLESMQINPLDNSPEKFISIIKERRALAQNGNLQIIQLSFTVSDIDYQPLKRMLERLERSLHLMDVSKFDYNPIDRSAKLEIYTYYLPS